MSEDVFRWVITAGIALSSVMTLVTAVVVLGMYRTSKRMEDRIGPVLDKAGPILDTARSIVDDARPKIEDIIGSIPQYIWIGPWEDLQIKD